MAGNGPNGVRLKCHIPLSPPYLFSVVRVHYGRFECPNGEVGSYPIGWCTHHKISGERKRTGVVEREERKRETEVRQHTITYTTRKYQNPFVSVREVYEECTSILISLHPIVHKIVLCLERVRLIFCGHIHNISLIFDLLHSPAS